MSTELLPRGGQAPAPSRSAYNRELSKARSKFPYDAVRGKKSPYNGRIIYTESDYDLYCHCYAILRLYEKDLAKTSRQISQERAQKRFVSEVRHMITSHTPENMFSASASCPHSSPSFLSSPSVSPFFRNVPCPLIRSRSPNPRPPPQALPSRQCMS